VYAVFTESYYPLDVVALRAREQQEEGASRPDGDDG
jgi:hypothetical protein